MKRSVIIAIIILVAGGLFGNYLRYSEQLPDRLASFGEIPMTTDTYVGEEHRFSDLSYEVLRADTSTLRLYTTEEGDRYWLFIAYFASQKYGSQIHSPKNCLPGGGWKIDRIEPFTLPLADGESKIINRLLIGDRDTKQLMFYWFETRGGAISNEFGLKFDLMKNSLLLRPTDAAIVRLTFPLGPNSSIDDASRKAVDYFNTFYPSIATALPFND